MKTIADYIQSVMEDDGATNTVSSGAIATKDVPLGGVAKRKPVDESDAYEGQNPLADNVGKFPLVGVGSATQNPCVTDKDASEEEKHRFHQKQQYQNDQVSSL